MKKASVQKIALERIYRLAELVRGEKGGKLRHRWIQLMKLVSMRNRARIPKELKKEFRKELNKLKKNKNELKGKKKKPK